MRSQPVVLLHGLATNAERTWRETGWIDLVADSGRTVIAPDLLGHGSAPQPTDPAEYRAFEQYVLDQLPDEQVDAVGFSLGARTLLILASAAPERFGRLVVGGVGANLFRGDGASGELAAALERGDESNPLVHHFSQLAASCGQSIDALVAVLRRPDPPLVDAALVGRITNETVVVLGDRDFAGPADPLMDALPNARLVTLRNEDHFSTPKAMGVLDAGLSHLDV